MGDAAYVPQLYGDVAVFVVYRLRDVFPRGDLLRGMQARRTGVAFRLEGNLRRFGHDQTGAGALRIILRHQRRGNVARFDAAQTRQRSHKHAVGQGDCANFQRREQFFSLHSASCI